MAEQVTITKAPPQVGRACACGGGCDDCRKKRARKSGLPGTGGPAAVTAPPLVQSVVTDAGSPLPVPVRQNMEGRFGADFSGVRVHTDARAGESARAIGARAYTVGQHVAFAPGHYDPESPAGGRLLAHELTHTLQQGHVRQMPAEGLPISSSYDPLEAEAERIADRVGGGFAAGPVVGREFGAVQRDGEPTTAATAGSNPANPDSNPPIPGTVATPLPPDPVGAALRAAGVVEVLDTDPPSTSRAYVLAALDLPGEKGPLARDTYEAMRRRGQLRVTIDLRSTASAGASQRRDSTSTLQRNWLRKVGWTSQNAKGFWTQAGGKAATSGFRPELASGTLCDIDHVVELQLGGTNSVENLQVLDPTPNRTSGSVLFGWLAERAGRIRDAYPAGQQPSQVTMLFRSINVVGTVEAFAPYTGDAPTCLQIEGRLAGGTLAGAGTAPPPPGRNTARLMSGAQGATAYLNATGATNLAEPINRPVRQLVPGFLLGDYTLGTGQNPDRIASVVDLRTGSTSSTTRPVDLDVTKQAAARLKAESGTDPAGGAVKNVRFDAVTDPVLRFHYPYLSDGNLRIAYSPEAGFSGTGTLTSDRPLLRGLRLGLSYERGVLSATLPANVANWRPLGSWARVTRAELAATLLPEFGAQGNLDLSFGSTSRPLATANFNISGDGNGLRASGTINAHIPKVNEAQGRITYQDGQWAGEVRVRSDQVQIPGVTECTVVLTITNSGIRAGGDIVMDVRGNPVRLGARLENGNWVFSGDATVNVPRLNPVRLSFRYEREHLTADGSTGFKWRDLDGSMTVHYQDGRISGEGTLNMTRGRMSGRIAARLLPSGVITADGTISYRITDSLVGTVGVSINEAQEVRLSGELAFTRPIPLFRRFGGDRRFDFPRISIPIAGIPLGVTTIGVEFRIESGLGFDYGVGPGAIHDLKVGAAFNPLEENPNLDLSGSGRLVIPASAGVSARVRGALGLSAGIASVSGGLTATARAGITIEAGAAFDFRYRDGKFAASLTPRIVGRPELSFTLEADVQAEAGVAPANYVYREAYELASYKLPLDTEAGAQVPLRYASDTGLAIPSLDDVQWIRPNVDVSGLMDGMLRRVGAL